MFKTATAFALALSIALPASSALASSDDAVPQEIASQIKSKLQAEGHDVRRVKAEDGYYEAYAMKDGKKMEIYFDSNLEVVKTKVDD
ncbi:PepSY domain-containing protein [Jhaorihella thermophila]|uniref:PepSY domain-containing protein n=2 Tax=Jhaorihella thermophila TaxID=488547 RepID=A0A1H5W8C1_9RHOB|nr:PepSY domain-containing protein [Jhaorihella thermophila]SEF95640.1 hypothetical protein SAMN05421751_107161 [Jhaorihella thermophila]